MKAITEYQIKLNDGLYVGLVNFGRTHAACKKKCRLKGLTEEDAKNLAMIFEGELTAFTFRPCIISNYGEGWEVELWEDTYEEAKEDLKAYNENCPQYPHRIKWRWEERDISLKNFV